MTKSYTVKLLQFEINELKPLQPGQVQEESFHLCEDGAARAVDVHLVALPGKVAGEDVGEGLDVGQLTVIPAPPVTRQNGIELLVIVYFIARNSFLTHYN